MEIKDAVEVSILVKRIGDLKREKETLLNSKDPKLVLSVLINDKNYRTQGQILKIQIADSIAQAFVDDKIQLINDKLHEAQIELSEL